MKYLLNDYEVNGYDDSDFYATFWDTERKVVASEMYGTTRAPSPRNAPSEYIRDIPDDIMQEAKEFQVARVFEYLCSKEIASVNEPDDCSRNDILETLKSGTFKDKKSGEKIEYATGEKGLVVWTGAFGTFYRNGYNKIGRHNLRVGIKFDDGRVVFIGLKDCKLARPMKTEAELMAAAERLVQYNGFCSILRMGI